MYLRTKAYCSCILITCIREVKILGSVIFCTLWDTIFFGTLLSNKRIDIIWPVFQHLSMIRAFSPVKSYIPTTSAFVENRFLTPCSHNLVNLGKLCICLGKLSAFVSRGNFKQTLWELRLLVNPVFSYYVFLTLFFILTHNSKVNKNDST